MFETQLIYKIMATETFDKVWMNNSENVTDGWVWAA